MANRLGVIWAALPAALVVVVSSTAAAQPLPPTNVRPPSREEIQRDPPRRAERGSPRLTVEGEIERAPCPLADPRFADVTFTLADVQFDNLRGADKADLAPAYADLVGKTVPIAQVCEIRDIASTILRRMGYLAAVQVPPQRIENGVVRFDVLMAKITSLQVRGDAGRSERLVAGYLEPLMRDEVFNQIDAERYLLLAKDIPGLDVRLLLKSANAGPGEVIGEVTVLRRPFDAMASAQNFGSKEVGPEGVMLRGQAYGLTGLGDRTSLTLFTTADLDEQQVIQLGHDFRFGPPGLTFGGSVTYAWTAPDVGGVVVVESETVVAELDVFYPVIRTQALSLGVASGLQYVDQDVTFNGLALTEDRVRMGFLRLELDAVERSSITGRGGYSAIEPRWRVSGALEARLGLDILDASPGCGPAPLYLACLGVVTPSRFDADPEGQSVRLEGRAEFRPTPLIALSFAPRLQYAPNPLASYEEYSTGNYSIGRGYDPGLVSGDSGAGFQFEISAGSLQPRSRTSLEIVPFVFYDAAWVWNGDAVIEEDRLQSIGAGLRMAYGQRGRLDITVAEPLERAPFQTNRSDTRILISLAAALWPWR